MTLTGRLDQTAWTSADGQKRSAHRVVADQITFLDPPTSGESTTDENGPAQKEMADRPALGAYRKRTSA